MQIDLFFFLTESCLLLLKQQFILISVYSSSRVSQPEWKAKDEEENNGNRPVRFAVRSLGWVRIAEEDLTPERSSKAVNKCIVDLSLGRNDINDAVGRWGDVSLPKC